ncbi:cation-translocating P-type ATPase [Aestuariimicrobium ganziense]|uniref:cation-translocating P-type ATPase n=1 Tax=Aestuariimicrobium ganziense TaxID=2773677 RepID=UPI00194590FF|nr:cation-translocating P-type ATPase [Aestuariimicrobium ganziense]
MTDPTLTEAVAVAEQAGTDPQRGLTTDEAARRLAADGPNELRAKPPEPLWRKVARQFQDPLVYLLFVAIAISLVAWLVEGAHDAPIDVIVISAIVILNAIIGLVQESRAESAVAALARMTAATSTVLRDGQLRDVPSSELVIGDVLVLDEGDAVGADARLLSATGLKVQESSLTGESEAVDKSADTLPEPVSLGDRTNMVFKGTAVVHGVGRALVTATAMNTQMGSIAEMLDKTESEPSPLDREVSSISKMLGVVVLAIAVVVMGVLFVINRPDDVSGAVSILLMGVSLAVAAVPEGLPAILSLVLAIGVRRLAERNAVMKQLPSVETLGSASVICSDKTGTLTRNEMTLRTIVTASGEVELSGTGYDPSDGEATGDHDDNTLREARLVLTDGSVANNAQLSHDADHWTITGDPTEAAFLVAQHKLDGVYERVSAHERRAEVPFSSERKMMSVVSTCPEVGQRLITKGAPDVLLSHCTDEQVGPESRPLDDVRRREILEVVDRLSGEGYRTLGVAHRRADGLSDDVDEDDEHDLTFLGVVGIIDPPRDEARAAVAEAHRGGVRVVMITGDHPVTAARIATDLGIVEPGARAMTGAELDELSEDEFAAATREVSVFARVAPEHKLRIVDALQADGHIVAMTGDGVNDAPALKSADIGVAMGITGTEVTKEAGEMILGDDNFATIVAAVRQGRGIFDNIKKFMRYLLSSNMGEVATVFFGIVLAGVIGLSDAAAAGTMAVPLLATQILWINLVTDSGPALAMGVDPDDGDLMARRPRRLDERIVDKAMWQRIIAIGLVMGLVSLATIDLFLPGGLIPGGTDSVETARTAAFTTLVIAQLFNALNARSVDHSAFSHLFTNKWLWITIAGAFLAQAAVVHVGFLQQAFGTTSLDLRHWLICLAMASVVLWYEEVAKWVRRHRRHADA